MTVTDQLAPPRTARSFSWIPGFLAGIILALVVVGGVLWVATGFGLYEASRIVRGGEVRINVDRPTVVRQIRSLQRIETVSYSMDKIVTGERENPIFPQFLAGDRLLLVVHGEVIAGLDLSKLQQSDVEVQGRTVSVRLPQAEIFTTRLDNAKTRVYSRDTGLFSTPDPNLEGEVREEAERQLRESALEDGILHTAESNARQTVTSMLTSLGFSRVEIH